MTWNPTLFLGVTLLLASCGGAGTNSLPHSSARRPAFSSKSTTTGSTATPPGTSVPLQRPDRPQRPSGGAPVVSSVLTTDDQANLMAPQTAVSFASGATIDEHTVIVDENQKFQQIEGFGAAFTDSSAYLLNEVATTRDAVMQRLFTRIDNGIGLSFMRSPMSASDLARSDYSYDDMPQGQTDPTLASFSIAHDQADIIPIILQAKQLNPQMKLMATPWSPPGWMKTSGSLIGGSLNSSAYSAYANYFVKYIQAYAAAGVTVDYLSIQNEPKYVPSDYPGMSMDAATQTTVLRDYILPALEANNITTRLLVYDHNWDDSTYSPTVFGDSSLLQSNQVAGTAWHWYGGTPGAMTTVRNQFPAKDNHVTEASGGTWITDEVKTDFETIIQSMRNWSKSYVKWGLALDQNRGPHTGGCSTCTPLVTINTTTGAATYPIDFYTLGHFSRFVFSGAVRINSSNATGIVSTAFMNPDGSKVLVAYNDTNASNTFRVVWGTESFSYTLPALAGATFTWSETQLGSYTVGAATKIQASSYNDVSGLQTETCSDTNGGYDLGFAADGSYAMYKNVDFASGLANVDARWASAGAGGTLEFHLDHPTGTLIASVPVPVTAGWQTWTTATGVVSGATGVHDLYVVFKGTTSIGNLNWFQFR